MTLDEVGAGQVHLVGPRRPVLSVDTVSVRPHHVAGRCATVARHAAAATREGSQVTVGSVGTAVLVTARRDPTADRADRSGRGVGRVGGPLGALDRVLRRVLAHDQPSRGRVDSGPRGRVERGRDGRVTVVPVDARRGRGHRGPDRVAPRRERGAPGRDLRCHLANRGVDRGAQPATGPREQIGHFGRAHRTLEESIRFTGRDGSVEDRVRENVEQSGRNLVGRVRPQVLVTVDGRAPVDGCNLGLARAAALDRAVGRVTHGEASGRSVGPGHVVTIPAASSPQTGP